MTFAETTTAEQMNVEACCSSRTGGMHVRRFRTEA